MGGSSGGGGGSAPAQAQPINYGSLMQQSGVSAAQMMKAAYDSMIKNYPSMERLQIGSAQNIGTLLSEDGGALTSWKQDKKGNWSQVNVGEAAPNTFTRTARLAAEDALGQRAAMQSQADKLAGIGDYITNEARRSYEASGPTALEAELQRQAEADLALGRELSPQEIRDAQQAARASMASRGLGQSAGTTAAEILNRDQYAQAREAARRNFAGSTNQLVTQNLMARRDQAAQQAALGGNLLGNAATGYGNVANLGLAGGQAMLGIDPVQRGLAPGLDMGGNTLNTMGSMTSNIYGNAMNLAGQVAGANASMLDSRYNSWANMQGARMAAGAMNQSGLYGMLGGIGGGLLSGVGMGLAMSDKREKTEIKPLGKSGSVLGLKTYSYKYKGDDKPRVGVMAQDVAKVLPQAVQEVNYKGKKRLAIKPAVIGAALAEELAAQAA